MHWLRRFWFCSLILLSCCGASIASDFKRWERQQLHAWCIVPFDAKKRTPEQRALMVKSLGLQRIAYDWRAEHVESFEDEVIAYQKHGIEFFAFWGIHDHALELFKKYQIRPQIWLTAPSPDGANDAQKIEAAVQQLLPAVEKTRQHGLKLGLYNHGGWGGEAEHLVAVCQALRERHHAEHVGIVYNWHHAHAEMLNFHRLWLQMQPYVLALNLNGMEVKAEARGRKILTLDSGQREQEMMEVVQRSGWNGPIGIIDHLAHTDSELTLRANLLGLERILERMKAGQSQRQATIESRADRKLVLENEAALTPGLLFKGDDAWREKPIVLETWVKVPDAEQF